MSAHLHGMRVTPAYLRSRHQRHGTRSSGAWSLFPSPNATEKQLVALAMLDVSPGSPGWEAAKSGRIAPPERFQAPGEKF